MKRITDRLILQVALESGFSAVTVRRYFGLDRGSEREPRRRVSEETARIVDEALDALSAVELRRAQPPRRADRRRDTGDAAARVRSVLATVTPDATTREIARVAGVSVPWAGSVRRRWLAARAGAP